MPAPTAPAVSHRRGQQGSRGNKGLFWGLLAVGLGFAALLMALVFFTLRGEDPGFTPTTYSSTPTDSVCGLGRVATEGSVGTPEAEWVTWQHMHLPVNAEHGPGMREPAPHCFERSPQGGMFAASAFALQLTNPKYIDDADLGRLFVGSEEAVAAQLEQLAPLRTRFDGADSALAGFRMVSYTPEEMVIEMAVTSFDGSETLRTGVLLNLVWADGDWYLDAEAATEGAEAPVTMTELPDVVGFQSWRA